MQYPKAVLSLIVGPVRTEQSGSQTILTHLQKYSWGGFMLTWPFCFHVWLFWKRQQVDQTGWYPGTEQGIYARTPGFRWDTELGMIFTKGYIGTHWD